MFKVIDTGFFLCVLAETHFRQNGETHFQNRETHFRNRETHFRNRETHFREPKNSLLACFSSFFVLLTPQTDMKCARKGKILIEIYSKRPKLFSKLSKLIGKESKLISEKQKLISISQKLISKVPKLISKRPKLISAGFHLSGLDWISHKKKACDDIALQIFYCSIWFRNKVLIGTSIWR